jgi:hypothetical protein
LKLEKSLENIPFEIGKILGIEWNPWEYKTFENRLDGLRTVCPPVCRLLFATIINQQPYYGVISCDIL